jgi:GNAT superfamily N-acetyltransferase
MALATQTAPQTLVTTYLEMTNPSQFKPAYNRTAGVVIRKMEHPDVDFYRFLYRAVGEQWAWRDRLAMSHDELYRELNKPTTHVHVMYVSGTPAGYIELSQQARSTEVAYFGLREAFFGRGLGKHLLSFGIEQAWKLGTERIWLHTCNLDGPHALNNYRKRGFQVYMRHQEPMPELYAS